MMCLPHATCHAMLLCAGLLTACEASVSAPDVPTPSPGSRTAPGAPPPRPTVLRIEAAAARGRGVVVELGRLRHTRLEMREAEAVLRPPRPGIPVLDATGAIAAELIAHLDGLGGPAGVREIELSVSPDVPIRTRDRVLAFLSRRGIAIFPPPKSLSE